MSISGITNRVEDQLVQLNLARSVLWAASKNFERRVEPGTIEMFCLARNLPRILEVLYVVDDLLRSMEPELQDVVKQLMGKQKEGLYE